MKKVMSFIPGISFTDIHCRKEIPRKKINNCLNRGAHLKIGLKEHIIRAKLNVKQKVSVVPTYQ